MTVAACVSLLALLALTLLMAQVGVAIAGRHHAQSAADLAALAAASELSAGTPAACARAADITRRMNVRLSACTAAEWDVTIVVEARMALGPLGTREVRAQARAGPVADRE
ncbi:Rv3654c family TadE-like protein [Nocardia sp. NPDC005978]|uniref:Rv3654c family TadE-like protein n=1 Tax=unclassified Nocardia TaxID=2637762 RepID=UPI0033A16754